MGEFDKNQGQGFGKEQGQDKFQQQQQEGGQDKLQQQQEGGDPKQQSGQDNEIRQKPEFEKGGEQGEKPGM